MFLLSAEKYHISLMGVVVVRGNCPTNRGGCPIGVIVLGVDVPRGSCPGDNWQRGSCPTGVIVLQGSCPQGSCPRGSCPRTRIQRSEDQANKTLSRCSLITTNTGINVITQYQLTDTVIRLSNRTDLFLTLNLG